MNARVSVIAALAVAALAIPALFIANRGAAAPKDVLASHIDSSASPAVDFFQYSNGAWLASNPIPPSESSWGIGNVIQDETYQRLRGISVDAAGAHAAKGTETQKIGDFWATAIDSALAERQGLSPLKAELDRIDAAKDLNGLLDVAFSQLPLQTGVLFQLYVGQDQKHSDVNAVQVQQDGLGLPDRDYYFNSDENSVRARSEYPKHVQKLLDLTNSGAAGAGDSVLAFETRLASVSRKLEDLRDPEKNYNKMATGEMTVKLTPSIDWIRRLPTVGLRNVDSVIVGQPEFFSGLDVQLRATPAPGAQGVPALPPDLGVRRVSRSLAGGAGLRLLSQGALGSAGAARALEARVGCGRGRAGTGARQAVRETVFLGGQQEALQRPGRRHPQRVSRSHQPARLDERRHQAEGAGQARAREGRRSATRTSGRIIRRSASDAIHGRRT